MMNFTFVTLRKGTSQIIFELCVNIFCKTHHFQYNPLELIWEIWIGNRANKKGTLHALIHLVGELNFIGVRHVGFKCSNQVDK